MAPALARPILTPAAAPTGAFLSRETPLVSSRGKGDHNGRPYNAPEEVGKGYGE
ncbi:MAG: hypothetical protein KatS3mg077_2507 [Candidatus Binatia bacterium]|nr:MAG: hypothetical protein KatS3mg077_2507 [Candidatus Binatia bacterium]